MPDAKPSYFGPFDVRCYCGGRVRLNGRDADYRRVIEYHDNRAHGQLTQVMPRRNVISQG